MNRPTLMVFDTASMYFRAFHGLPSSIRSPRGEPVNAVRGLLDAIARLVQQYRPDELACAWDNDWRPAWRVELVPSYKTHRLAAGGGTPEADQTTETGPGPAGTDVVGAGAGSATAGTTEDSPPGLAHQVPVIREVLGALGISVIGRDRHEADDVIGSLARQHRGSQLVVTGDRDLFQLADGNTRVVYIGKGVARHDLVDDAWVQERHGVPASRYVDYAVLRGDPSDGLPGVKGIGEKSAAQLVQRFGGLEGILAAAQDSDSPMTPAVRSRLASSLDYLAAARTVVEVVVDLPLPELEDGSLVRDPRRIDHDALARLDERWGLGSPLERIVTALQD